MPLCLVNMGCYGLLFLLYLNAAIALTHGAGFTGPTVGVVLAALTFSAMGQHPRNIWPIFLGYQVLYVLVFLVCTASGRQIAWSVSTQGYINAVAFATGLCPIVGRYGKRAGVAAGFLSAALCTSTSALHGGLILYNGGFTAGITAMLLVPVLEHYIPAPRSEMSFSFRTQDSITIIENPPETERLEAAALEADTSKAGISETDPKKTP